MGARKEPDGTAVRSFRYCCITRAHKYGYCVSMEFAPNLGRSLAEVFHWHIKRFQALVGYLLRVARAAH